MTDHVQMPERVNGLVSGDTLDCCTNPVRCVYCECVLTQKGDGGEDRPTDRNRDHLIPRSRGGSDHVENCVIACRACNLAKRDKTPSEWRTEGLPAWVYAKEKALAAKYRMPCRGRVKSPEEPSLSSARIPGYALLKTRTAICLEWDRQLCGRPADWEIRSFMDGTWGANCERCAGYYSKDLRRELDEQRSILHVLVQLRDGTLDVSRETVLAALAKAGGVPIEEYLDMAIHMLTGEEMVRAALKDSFPSLHLELWEPVA